MKGKVNFQGGFKLIHHALCACMYNSAVQNNTQHTVLENKGQISINPTCFGQDGPFSGRIYNTPG